MVSLVYVMRWIRTMVNYSGNTCSTSDSKVNNFTLTSTTSPINDKNYYIYWTQFKPYESFVILHFSGLSGTKFNFLPNGDPPARYRILNFRQPTPGHYEWVDVGNFYNKELEVSQFFVLINSFYMGWLNERQSTNQFPIAFDLNLFFKTSTYSLLFLKITSDNRMLL